MNERINYLTIKGKASQFGDYSLMYTVQLLNLLKNVNTNLLKGFLGGSVLKNLPANAGDTGDAGSIPGLERSPEGRNGIQL